MPLYFFHLTFGDRVSLDAEGVELPSRCAACEEAMESYPSSPTQPSAAIPDAGQAGSCRLRTSTARSCAPIGHPALQLVSEDQEPVRVRSGMMLDVRPNSLRDRTAQLLGRNRRLRYQLLCEFLACEKARVHATYRAAAKPTRRPAPDLVVLPGGR